jgi:hypothetical protein
MVHDEFSKCLFPVRSLLHVSQRIQESESLEQPDHDSDHNNDIKNVFDLAIHRDVGVYQPKQHSDDD